jgi:ribonuclease E
MAAKRVRRQEGRDSGRKRTAILSEAEFLARREAVDRTMVVRQKGDRTQIAVLEDGILVEHYVTRASAQSYAGNVYLGRVQNVLPSMEAAFVDIGKSRNAVLYAGEVNYAGLGGGRSRSIESVLKSGQEVLVQVSKDPIGHKGARLTGQVSLPGRYLVYVPEGSMTGISRKLPEPERERLKAILKKVVPDDAGVIIRTAAEGASEEEIAGDVRRLQAQWEVITTKAAKGGAPVLLHAEPDLVIRVVRDVFNEDFTRLVVQGDSEWHTIRDYVEFVAPDLAPRLSRHTSDKDVFAEHRVDEQLLKALDRKVYLPSGGSLVIDRTEAMVVIDVNTGKFVGKGGNLEETVTRNNLEAAEEIARQLRLRDIGGIIVVDFIDMVLESNRDLVVRRLVECLGRDRTKHQVAEVTSLGLVQMTRKRVGQGLLESFSEPCESCNGRGVHVHPEPWTSGAAAGATTPRASAPRASAPPSRCRRTRRAPVRASPHRPATRRRATRRPTTRSRPRRHGAAVAVVAARAPRPSPPSPSCRSCWPTRTPSPRSSTWSTPRWSRARSPRPGVATPRATGRPTRTRRRCCRAVGCPSRRPTSPSSRRPPWRTCRQT